MTPPPDPPDLLLHRYIAGECPANEVRELEAQLAASVSLRRRLAELRLLVHPESPREPWDLDAMWSRVRARTVDAQPPARRRPVPVPVPVPVRPVLPEARRVSRYVVAAMLLVALTGAGALLVRRSGRLGTPAPDRAQGDYRTSIGQLATVQLTDGSSVTLAPASRLIIPSRFGRETRDIELEGEAIFEVRHDAAHPFRVRARSALIEDVGTRFDLRAYPTDATVTVVVAEGAVSLGRLDRGVLRGSKSDRVVLHRDDVGALDSAGQATSTHTVDASRYLGWANGRLSFVNRPLSEVLLTFGRWYDLDVRAPDSRLASRRVTADFSTQSPSEMIDALAMAVDATVERAGRVVTMRPR